MNHQEIRYALAKQVPDMAKGFGIATGYGDIIIPPGQMADRLARHVQRALERELLGGAQNAPSAWDLPPLPQQPILGAWYEHRPAAAPSTPASCRLCQECPHRLAVGKTPATGE